MSMMAPGRRVPGPATVGETVGSFPRYEAAQKAVSELVAAEIPPREIQVVGIGLRSVEQVTGRLGWGAAARAGAINGILIGLFFGALIAFSQPELPLQVFLGVAMIGVALGMVFSLTTHALVRRRRDFASYTQVLADRYEVAVAPASAGKARQVLGARAVDDRRDATDSASSLASPPRYGVRIDPATGDPAQTAPGGDDDERRAT